MENGSVSDVNRKRSAFFNDTSVGTVAACGDVSGEVDNVTDMDILQIFSGNRVNRLFERG